MRFAPRVVLAVSALLCWVPTASALQWNCGVPEIDGPAGISAMAVLLAAGAMVYERYKA